MHPATRAAVIKRYQAIVGVDAIVPTEWNQIGNLTLQMAIEQADPELAAVLKGQMNGDLEIAVAEGSLSDKAPAPRDLKAEHDAAINEAMAKLAEDAQAMREANERRNAAAEAHRQASRDLSIAQLKAQAGGYR